MEITRKNSAVATPPLTRENLESFVWATLARSGSILRMAWLPMDRTLGHLILTFLCTDRRFVSSGRVHAVKKQLSRETDSILWSVSDAVERFAWSELSLTDLRVRSDVHHLSLVFLACLQGERELTQGAETQFPIPLEIFVRDRHEPYRFGG